MTDVAGEDRPDYHPRVAEALLAGTTGSPWGTTTTGFLGAGQGLIDASHVAVVPRRHG